jgi:hypothetical protein
LIILPVPLQDNGQRSESDSALKALVEKHDLPYWVAANYAYRGEHDLALRWLDRAYAERDPELVWILGEHLFKNVADDPRFKAFLKKMNLPE